MAFDLMEQLEKYESQIDLFRRNQHRFFIGAIVLLIVYILINSVAPSFSSYRQKSKELAAYKQTLEKKRLNVLDKESMARQISEAQTSLSSLKEGFFTLPEFNEFAIDSLTKLVERNGGIVQSIRYKPASNRGKNMMAYPLTISIEAPFMSIATLMDALENYDKFVRITSLSFNAKSIDPPRLGVVLEMEAYVTR